VAEDDVYDVTVDETLQVVAPGVLDNDTDPEGSPLSAQLVDPPEQGGDVVLRPDGSFDYTPPPGYLGNDAFTYQASDGSELSNLAEVTLRIGTPQTGVVTYTDETAFLADLAALGYAGLAESFEDEAAWGAARTPTTAPAVVSRRLVWTANNPDGGVTTGGGPARTGSYGFYCLPHGNPATGVDCNIPGNCTDGWIVTAPRTLYAAGAWIETNTPPAGVELFLDGVVVDFGNDSTLTSGAHMFRGIIDPAGFSTYEVHETEGTSDDFKLLFVDDYTFGLPADVFLEVSRGPIPEEVRLEWWGGQSGYTVYRAEEANGVATPGNAIGSTSQLDYVDAPPTGAIFFYLVSGS
jgi:hypothetical protein